MSDFIIQIENLQDIMFSYEVDLFGPFELDSQYCCELTKQIVNTCTEFIQLMDACKSKLGVQLVSPKLIRKIVKLQHIAQYGLIEQVKPGALDSHIDGKFVHFVNKTWHTIHLQFNFLVESIILLHGFAIDMGEKK